MGFLLRQLQEGEMPSLPHSRPMPSVGKACHELRVNDETKTWRLFYFIETEAIVILGIGEKRTQKTLQSVIRLCQKRLKSYEQAQKNPEKSES